MEEPNTFTASDLIHLYLDGEADSVQQSMLFGTLASSSDLQMEFTEALRIRRAIEHERAHTVPPPHVTKSLFEMAGFASPAPEIAGAATVTQGVSRGFFGKFGVPIITAIGSGLLALLVLNQINQDRYDDLNMKLQQMSAERAGDTVRLSASRLPVASSAPQINPPQQVAQTEVLGSDSHRETYRTAPASRIRYRTADPDEGTVATAIASPDSIVADHTIIAASPRTLPPASAKQESNTDKNNLHASSDSLETTDAIAAFTENQGYWGNLTLQIRGITDLKHFPDRNTERVAQPWHNNMSIGALYQLSEYHAIGVEGGSEFLPLYHNDGTTFALEPRQAWIAGIYRFQAGAINDAVAIRPFIQAALGGTRSGPMGRGILGLAYMPGGPIDFSVGMEGTTVLYPLRNNWYSTRKMGFTYLMNVHF